VEPVLITDRAPGIELSANPMTLHERVSTVAFGDAPARSLRARRRDLGGTEHRTIPVAVRVRRKRILLSTAACTAVVLAFGTSSLSAPPGGDPARHVALLYRTQSGHQEAASALERVLHEAGMACVRIELPTGDDEIAEGLALQRLVEAHPLIVAAGGTRATSLALESVPETPVIFFMVPNALDAPFMAPTSPARRRVAGVTTDIAPDEQINWLTTMVPKAKTVGLMTSSRTSRTAKAVQAAGKRLSVRVVPIEASKDEFMPAIDALSAYNCDAALMIADARVYNSVSVQRLLLWGLSEKKAVSAFSPHVVKAGALYGQYCDNDAIGFQAARMVLQVIGGAETASIGVQYPDLVHLAVNERTADLIGITLDKIHLPPDAVRYGRD